MELWKQNVWNTGTLASGAHTVTIEWTGSKNGSARATTIGIDAVQVVGTLAGATAVPVSTRYEQNDSRLAYTGNWTPVSTSGASNGSFVYANSRGSSVIVKFTGTMLNWIAKKSPVYGKAKVTIDGRTPAYVDLYSPKIEWQQKVWTTGTLAPGTHTVKIEWTGTRNAAATNTNIGLDAVEVIGSLTQAP